MTLSAGTRLGPYEILELAGSGGMGEVYRARDVRLDRIVAVKVLPEALLEDPDRRRRLEREARAVSRLSHPHICTLYDIGNQNGVDYLVMEYLEGETLAQQIEKGILPIDNAMRYALEIAEAVDAAHRQGIIHSDLKPGNIMLTRNGVKLLDFGLARIVHEMTPGSDGSAVSTLTWMPLTRTGMRVGTPAYMSPEQAAGSSADVRSDVFSFGVLLYEMITGQRAFSGDSPAQTMASILRDTPAPARTFRPELGPDLESIIDRCLQKDANNRYPNGTALLEDLRTLKANVPTDGRRSATGRRWALALLSAVALAAIGFSAWTWQHLARERWARRTVLPEITRLSETDQVIAAYHRARDIKPLLKGDPEFEKVWRDVSTLVSMDTDPPGAKIYFKPYAEPKAPWELAGVSPLKNFRAPIRQLRWKLVKEGYEVAELASPQPASLKLVPEGQAPPGMVYVPGGRYQYLATRDVQLPDYYWLDRFEVTNRQFKRFVDAGGYKKPEYWKQPFAHGNVTLGFDEAMALFRDTTGRPGPATWELGSFPEGQADFPVGGVSWYEAVAYAEFAGKSLPTFHHWFHAAGADVRFSEILALSNFGGQGAAAVGTYQGMSPWGAYDMAGNVREWVWNAAGDRRYTLGGSWNDPTYLFTGPDATDPFDRSPTHGFRCAIYPTPPPAEAYGSIETIYIDFSHETPVEESVFAAYRNLYRYDPAPLAARIDSTDTTPEHWREERVSFAAAYGGERISGTLFLPKNAVPPYQVVLFFPPGGALSLNSIREAGTRSFAFLIKSGRALFFPSYKGTYERRLPPGATGPNDERDTRIQWAKDVGRSLDYLETRPDIDRRSFAYYGLSMGAAFGPVVGALEPRLRAMVLVAGGLYQDRTMPEVDSFNFAPHARVPVLMINGDHDFLFPVETSQKPLFRLFPLPSDQKRHVVLEGGHVPAHYQEIARETLDWLDRFMGPVRATAEP